jgi:hypothetical protein
MNRWYLEASVGASVQWTYITWRLKSTGIVGWTDGLVSKSAGMPETK